MVSSGHSRENGNPETLIWIHRCLSLDSSLRGNDRGEEMTASDIAIVVEYSSPGETLLILLINHEDGILFPAYSAGFIEGVYEFF